MPKHALTFKHFLGTRPPPPPDRRSRSVNELLATSRHSTTAGAALESGSAAAAVQGPQAVATVGDRARPPHLWGESEDAVHPAELLRREQVAHAQAARSVAGPAPPRSWRAPPKPERNRDEDRWKDADDAFVARQMADAAAFLGRERPPPPPVGPPPLVQTCIHAVLDTIAGRVESPGYGAADMAEAMLLASRELDIGLRGRILAESASLLPHDARRLSDGATRGLLHYRGKDGSDTWGSARRPSDTSASARHEPPLLPVGAGADDWEDDDVAPTLPHLAFTAHPAPLRLLQDVPRMLSISLMSLDLAFATLPAMDKVVNVLPPSLRALGLAGVRSAEGYSSWSRGFGALGRKMTVLQLLDISYLPIAADPMVHALFGDAERSEKHLPSLRRLGMRGNVNPRGNETAGGEAQEATESAARGMTRAMVKDLVNRGRKWVEIEFGDARH